MAAYVLLGNVALILLLEALFPCLITNLKVLFPAHTLLASKALQQRS